MHAEPLAAARAEAVWEMLAAQVRSAAHCDVASELALGRRLAADVTSAHDYPPFDRALMDGYAVRCADFARDIAAMRCAGLARAGGAEPVGVESGACLQINTGAPLPRFADAVVAVEESRTLSDGSIEVCRKPSAGENIERRAALRRSGELLLASGVRVGAGEIVALVSGGTPSVRVFEQPRVALLTTGDELAASAAALKSGQIPESNSFALRPLVENDGGVVGASERCPDDEAVLRTALAAGLKHDVLIVTGGMSKGSHDLVPRVLESLGVRWLVSSLDLKPGKPMRIGRGPGGAWVLGLPGNPVSCIVCYLLFGRPIMAGLQGSTIRPPSYLTGRLETPMPGNGARPMFQPAEWQATPSGYVALRPLDWRGSGDPFGLIGANALAYRPERVPPAAAGDPVQFLPIDMPR